MAGIPEHVIDEVRERADIVGTVGRHVTLKKSGGRYWGLCPFHGEKTPSFSVHPEKQIFYCFGCHAHGDVFSFRMQIDGCDFPDAVRALARENSVHISEGEQGQRAGHAARLYEANEVALAYFREVLGSAPGAAVRDYLRRRDLPAELIAQLQIGAAPDEWDGLIRRLQRSSVSLDDAQAAGLIVPRQNGSGFYDRFRGRVVFPILEPGGRIAGFGARTLGDDVPKYLNSPETPIYRKSRVLFGLPAALDAVRRTDRLVVVEGYFDVTALHRAGIHEVVATCGTALTAEHARRVCRYARDVVLLFDGDAAGQRAAERALPLLLAEGLVVRGAFLPPGDDPDTLLARAGADALADVVDRARPLLDGLIADRAGFAKAGARQAADIVRELGPWIDAVPDPVERAGYVRDLASRLEHDPETIEAAIAETRERNPARERSRDAERTAVGNAALARLRGDGRGGAAPIDPRTAELISALVTYPALVAELFDAVPGFAADWLPPASRTLAWSVIETIARDPSGAALAALISERPETYGAAGVSSNHSLAMPAECRRMLASIMASEGPASQDHARCAVFDCIARLEDEVLKSRYRDLSDRLESCNDPGQEEALLQEMQQILLAKGRGEQRRRSLLGQS